MVTRKPEMRREIGCWRYHKVLVRKTSEILLCMSYFCVLFSDPYEDQFEKRGKAKNERVAKNELQRLRNVARNMKGKSE